MTFACQKLIGSLLIVALIYGNDAACTSQVGLAESYNLFVTQLSTSCAADIIVSGQPPTCTSNSTLCAISVEMTLTVACIGGSCESVPKEALEPVSGTKVEPLCVPSSCQNDVDSKKIQDFGGYYQMGLACLEAEKREGDLGLANVSFNLTMSLSGAGVKSSCQNSKGEIEIDGKVIYPEPQEGDEIAGEGCMGPDAVQRAYESEVSPACAADLNLATTGEPPECSAASDVCGISVEMTLTPSCTGSQCDNSELEELASSFGWPGGAPRSETKAGLLCRPHSCANDADSRVLLEGQSKWVMAKTCSDARGHLMPAMSSLNVSIDFNTVVRFQGSCDKNAAGEIEIDGKVINSAWHDEDDINDLWHGTDYTCRDVKSAFKMYKCCDDPNKVLPAGGLEGLVRLRRRLKALRHLSPEEQEEEIGKSVKAALRRAEAKGGAAKANKLAQSLRDILEEDD